MYRDKRRYYGKRRDNKQYRPHYKNEVSQEELKKFKYSYVVIFIKAFIAVALGIIIGIAFDFGIYHGLFFKDFLILTVGTATGVLALIFIFRYRIFKQI